MANDNAAGTQGREIVITRLLKAPRELVFKAWTQPAHLAQWWGPDGFTSTLHSMDVKVGGKLTLTLHGMGRDFPNVMVYTEIIEPAKLAYRHGSREEDGPDTFYVTITFDEEDGNTRLTMRSLFKTAEARDYVVNNYGAVERGNETINHLEEFLAKLQHH